MRPGLGVRCIPQIAHMPARDKRDEEICEEGWRKGAGLAYIALLYEATKRRFLNSGLIMRTGCDSEEERLDAITTALTTGIAFARVLLKRSKKGINMKAIRQIQDGVVLTPIEVAWVERPEGSYYFAFGGCHRWAAHIELGSATIPARLIKVSPATINTFLGSSSPFRSLG
ncbi:hypothetical protein VOLCADRAFT_105833 [Volvox carteri f. nagariensis]|uniref:sulfiredoxin n=1 Tax=Volvox carteri f. nagariensis TaxID=3068 RepID=D8U3G2_VOLCA|nr:uncharacterized protein VOLCADRAFT_105833 [Volvox carteri f. nagariensis]EFJ45749.1 hypothetical protein VOLCADRAFT_105833 [Volvox carteri f. nagariensis]|eukprot:XP_002953150.1 hypothetical protein VOLCADRAFT_105833 [Volvox carteri f. nagariensis]